MKVIAFIKKGFFLLAVAILPMSIVQPINAQSLLMNSDKYSAATLDLDEGVLRVKGMDLLLKASEQKIIFKGPGYKTSLVGAKLSNKLKLDKLGIREHAPLYDVSHLDIPLTALGGPAFACGGNSYTLTAGSLKFTRRLTSDENRPAPYTPEFDAQFPVGTWAGTVEGEAVNQNGEVFTVTGLDSLDEVLSPPKYSAVAALYINFINQAGVVVDQVALAANIVNKGEGTDSVVVNSGSCYEIDAAGKITSGPFFIVPFTADRLITITTK